MKKQLYINGEYSGEIGKTVFKDSLGKQLCVGDIVYTIGDGGHNSINIIADSYVYGWAWATLKGNFKEVSAYKLMNYTHIEKLDERIKSKLGDNFEIKRTTREMTISQIEEELGYSIKIIKEK